MGELSVLSFFLDFRSRFLDQVFGPRFHFLDSVLGPIPEPKNLKISFFSVFFYKKNNFLGRDLDSELESEIESNSKVTAQMRHPFRKHFYYNIKLASCRTIGAQNLSTHVCTLLAASIYSGF